MHHRELSSWRHPHSFGAEGRARGERRTAWVVALTLAMMSFEIVAGMTLGSMSLLADGWHMGTHAAALSVAWFAYVYSRRHASDSRFSFGTGKVGALAGFASAVGLAVVALLVFGESAQRLATPVSIRFDEAIAVACLGLAVNVACALLLRDAHEAPASTQHAHSHSDHHHHHDHNLRGAYLHVLADALTSLLAIAGLTAGKLLGWTWMDPAMGLVGALVVARWSFGLLRGTSRVLLDAELSRERCAEIERAIEADADNRVTDLHVWRVGPRHLAAIVSLVTHEPREPEHYKRLLRHQPDLTHVTIEVHRCPDGADLAA